MSDWLKIDEHFKYKWLRGTKNSSNELFEKFRKENNVTKVMLPGSMTSNKLKRYLPSDYNASGIQPWHGAFNTDDFQYRIFDHLELYKIRNKDNVLISHPYCLENSEKYPVFNSDGTFSEYATDILRPVNSLLNYTGYDMIVCGSETDWYNPTSTALIIIKRPETVICVDNIIIYGKREKLSFLEWLDLEYHEFSCQKVNNYEFHLANHIPYEVAVKEEFGVLYEYVAKRYRKCYWKYASKLFYGWKEYNQSVEENDFIRKKAVVRCAFILETEYPHFVPDSLKPVLTLRDKFNIKYDNESCDKFYEYIKTADFLEMYGGGYND